MLRKFNFSVGEFYHAYNRGNDKRVIFTSPVDYKRFQKLLFLCNSKRAITVRDIPRDKIYFFDRIETLVNIGAYCLMPNHFHLLLKEKTDRGISRFMKKLLTAYSMYFNARYKRKGVLFEGRFKASHARTDRYLKYLFSYIHLNPLKLKYTDWKEKGVKNWNLGKKYLDNYEFSSFYDHNNQDRSERSILDINEFPEYFQTQNEIDNSILDWFYSKPATPEDGPLW